ncbi:MAG: hypothetical protein WC238_05955 [Parcubacteria group bacterium]|jgi:DNA-directed RNA polymerase subunit M/transcription elongation factor TFIIS
MPLKFCEHCGSILRNQQIDDKRSYLFCDKCQKFELTDAKKDSGMTSNETLKKEKQKGEGVHELTNEFATYTNVCKKCGYDKAQIIDMGIFYSDEDNLILLKCGKCGFSERIGRKTT